MARHEVIQLRCDRCKRVDLVAPIPKKALPDFEARLGDQTLLYEDLCYRCKQAVENIWKDLKEWDREIVQPFGPTVASNEAPPLTSAPDYSPPKPHSAAGTKR